MIISILYLKSYLMYNYTDTGDREDSNSMSTPNIIYINYQELLFSSSKFYLGWNLFDQKNTVQNITPGLRYSVVSSTCNLNAISTRINATGTTAVIPLDGDENLYYSIIALNETSRLNEPFWINEGGTQLLISIT